MSKTLELTRENAIAAYDQADKKFRTTLEILFGKDIFLKDVTQRLISFDAVCKEMGKSRMEYETASTNPDIISGMALAKWLLIVTAFNKSTAEVVNWFNSSQWKYVPWMVSNKAAPSGWSLRVVAGRLTRTDACARQHFLKKEHFEFAMTVPEFKEIFLTYFV
ncbi:hypothetical protein [Flavobacterium sp. 3HN19-14]|uniref:hypothetical protein n=1 Tax=Flavobacterium sp. 3HN19-14 TaxID=3448133 RepID=UPI003EDF5B06